MNEGEEMRKIVRPRPPFKGVLIISTPKGEVKIDGLKVCRTESPEECREEDPDTIRMRVDIAWHHGWPIRRVK